VVSHGGALKAHPKSNPHIQQWRPKPKHTNGPYLLPSYSLVLLLHPAYSNVQCPYASSTVYWSFTYLCNRYFFKNERRKQLPPALLSCICKGRCPTPTRILACRRDDEELEHCQQQVHVLTKLSIHERVHERPHPPERVHYMRACIQAILSDT